MKPARLTEARPVGFLFAADWLVGGGVAIIVSLLALVAMRLMGVLGLIMIFGALLAALATLFLLVRYPILICILWFFTMSGMQTLGMIRMPGLPDFSIARMFLLLVLIMMPIGVIRGRRLFKPPHVLDLMVLAHALYVLANLYLVGDGTHLNTWIASSMTPAVGYFFAKQYMTRENQLRVLFAFFTVVSVYFWVTCIGEHFEISGMVWPKAILNREIGHSWFGRSRGPFLQPALTGQILGWYIMVQIYLLTRPIRFVWKFLMVGNIVMSGVGLLFTYTRGPWLATAVGLLVMALLRPRFRKIFIAAGVALVLLMATDFLKPSQDEFLEERLGTTNTIDNRLGFFSTAMRMIQEKPLFGIGFFRYMDLAPLYNQGTYIPFYGFVKKGAGVDVAIHDIYIGRAAEEGLVSLGLFLGLLGMLAGRFRRRWREVQPGGWFDRDFIALIVGIFVSYLVLGLIIDHRYFDLINVLPLFLASIVVSYPLPGEPGGEKPAGVVQEARSIPTARRPGPDG